MSLPSVIDEPETLPETNPDPDLPPEPQDGKRAIPSWMKSHSNLLALSEQEVPNAPDQKQPEGDPSRVLPGWMNSSSEEDTQEEIPVNISRQRSKFEQRNFSEEFPLVDWPFTDITDISELQNGRVICFDVETTGFARDDCIIEIGAVELIDGFRTGCIFQSYIKNRKDVHPRAQDVHGISNQKLSKAPPCQLILASFIEWVGKSPLVAHNAKFDMRLLLQDATYHKIASIIQDKPVFCTLRYYRQKFPKTSYGLSDLATRFEISLDYKSAHTALADAEVLAKGLQAMMDRFGKRKNVPDLVRTQSKPTNDDMNPKEQDVPVDPEPKVEQVLPTVTSNSEDSEQTQPMELEDQVIETAPDPPRQTDQSLNHNEQQAKPDDKHPC